MAKKGMKAMKPMKTTTQKGMKHMTPMKATVMKSKIGIKATQAKKGMKAMKTKKAAVMKPKKATKALNAMKAVKEKQFDYCKGLMRKILKIDVSKFDAIYLRQPHIIGYQRSTGKWVSFQGAGANVWGALISKPFWTRNEGRVPDVLEDRCVL